MMLLCSFISIDGRYTKWSFTESPDHIYIISTLVPIDASRTLIFLVISEDNFHSNVPVFVSVFLYHWICLLNKP